MRHAARRDHTSRNFNSTTSCRYLIQVHLIFVVKYRRKILFGTLNDDIVQKLLEISSRYDFDIMSVNSDGDHVHMLVSLKPSVSVSQVVRVLKQESTVHAWRKYGPVLKCHFWRERTLWSDGYFAASIGNANETTVRRYIENQGHE